MKFTQGMKNWKSISKENRKAATGKNKMFLKINVRQFSFRDMAVFIINDTTILWGLEIKKQIRCLINHFILKVQNILLSVIIMLF